MDAPPGFVLLLSQPRHAAEDLYMLAASFSRASGRTIKPAIPDRPRIVQQIPDGDVVVAVPSASLVRIGGITFLVHSGTEPYFANAEEVAVQLANPRERLAVESHRAWLSVELMQEEDASAENYGIISRVAADLLGSDCLALFHPESGRLAVPDQETPHGLRTARPLEAVFGRGGARADKRRHRDARLVYRRLHW